MINIIESASSKKVVGKTSLYLSFEYNQKIIEIIKTCSSNAVWHKDLKVWEVPLNQLSKLIDELVYIDDITLELEPDNKENELVPKLDYKTKPYQYQLDGIKYLLNNPNSLLLDAPGLGKTLQVIYTAEELRKQQGIEHCLIICGINSLKTNWKKEIQKHSDSDCIIIGEKINSKGNVTYTTIPERAKQLYNKINEFFVILNIESLRDNSVIDGIRNGKNKFDLIVMDEIHKCKSSTSYQGKNLLKLSKVGKYHIGLTGTLIMNDPLDAYVPLKFIGADKSTLTAYKQCYCIMDSRCHNQVVGFKNMDLLKNIIDGNSLRRTKDLLELPPKTIIPEYLEMDSSHQKLYDDVKQGVMDEIDLVELKASNLLGLVVRLRQATSCPSILTSHQVEPTKIDRAIELVEDIVSNGEKVVIFSTFKEPLNILFGKLQKYKPLLNTGDIDDDIVSKNIDIFQSDKEHKVFLATTSKCGTGITLTSASYEIFIDTPWTYAEFEQCCDRCYRIGSTKPVIIYNLICNNTIDEKVFRVINKKKDISDHIVDDKVNNLDTPKELLEINSFF